MGIRDKENELFREWIDNTSGTDFVYDGVVNPNEWEKMPIHIVFLLKETNGFCGDLRNFLNAGGRWMTWNNVARWTYILRQRIVKKDAPKWNLAKRVYNETRKYNLRKIAVINVKKGAGTAVTNTKELINAFRKENKSFLFQQLNILGHIDYIVCCGNGVAACYEECIGEKLEWERIHPHIRKTTNQHGTFIIDFFHPQSRQSAESLFCLFDKVIGGSNAILQETT